MLLLLYCSQEGLPLSEQCQLLGYIKNNEPITMMASATLNRQLRPFTRVIITTCGGRIAFRHSAVKEVCFVIKHLLWQS